MKLWQPCHVFEYMLQYFIRLHVYFRYYTIIRFYECVWLAFYSLSIYIFSFVPYLQIYNIISLQILNAFVLNKIVTLLYSLQICYAIGRSWGEEIASYFLGNSSQNNSRRQTAAGNDPHLWCLQEGEGLLCFLAIIVWMLSI